MVIDSPRIMAAYDFPNRRVRFLHEADAGRGRACNELR